jgi:hypothetical protein
MSEPNGHLNSLIWSIVTVSTVKSATYAMTNEPNVTHVMSNISDEQAMCIKQLHATVIN